MAQIKVPTLGESVSEATVAKWLKAEGDAVEQDEPLVELETDKVTLEVNAPESGVISKIIIAEGENVEVGALLGEIGAGAPSNSNAKKDDKPAAKKEEPKKETKAAASAQKLSPSVEKLVRDNDVDTSNIKGTGKDGRITKEDVAANMAAPTPHAAEPKAPRDTGPREERVKMTRLRQSIAKRLKEAQNEAAILTTFNEIDMGAIMDLRKEYKDAFEKKHGVKLGFMSFFVKAAVAALKDFPAVNAEIDGEDIIYKNFYDIGVAVSTPQGLVVPVVRDADEKSMADIEKDILDLSGKAREGKISMADMTGGTFTITNGGVFGSLMSTPILNRPQSAILGMHKIEQRPMVMPNGEIKARPMMYVAMSYDHRIIDGRESVSFLVRIKDAIEDPQRLLLGL